MVDYGVTQSGFKIKPFATILAEKAERARQMFGADVDLRSTSVLRKLLEITSYEDLEVWKVLEQQFYSNFLSTASGEALDRLGEDLGVERPFRQAQGLVKLQLSGQVSGVTYYLPQGTLLETDSPIQYFRTLTPVTLSEQLKEVEVEVESQERGVSGNVAAPRINKINASYQRRYLNLRGATVAVSQTQPTVGGEQQEDDLNYRDRLLGYPRTLWTLESVSYVVKNIDGVRDCRLFDPSGGVDVSLSKFSLFAFNQRRFGRQRDLVSPYYFDIQVALEPGWLWESEGAVIGVKEKIATAIGSVRPLGIFPNLRRANNVLVGIRAKVLIKSGHDHQAALAAIKTKLVRRLNTLGLGNSVLYAEVLCDAMAVENVIDVQQLHLRRCPPLFSRINFGQERFQSQIIEAAIGENLQLQPEEIAEFRIDSLLNEIEVSDR